LHTESGTWNSPFWDGGSILVYRLTASQARSRPRDVLARHATVFFPFLLSRSPPLPFVAHCWCELMRRKEEKRKKVESGAHLFPLPENPTFKESRCGKNLWPLPPSSFSGVCVWTQLAQSVKRSEIQQLATRHTHSGSGFVPALGKILPRGTTSNKRNVPRSLLWAYHQKKAQFLLPPLQKDKECIAEE